MTSPMIPFRRMRVTNWWAVGADGVFFGKLEPRWLTKSMAGRKGRWLRRKHPRMARIAMHQTVLVRSPLPASQCLEEMLYKALSREPNPDWPLRKMVKSFARIGVRLKEDSHE